MRVSVHKVRGLSRDPKALLNPLAQGVETTKIGLPSKECGSQPLASENQSGELGKRASWEDEGSGNRR